MLKFIFYLFGIVAILFELWSIYNFKKLTSFGEKLQKNSKLSEEEKVPITYNENVFIFCIWSYFLWTFVGLFTSQWVLFLGLIMLSLLTGLINKIKRTETWNFVDSVLSISIILLAILNTYHFHIDFGKKFVTFLFGQDTL